MPWFRADDDLPEHVKADALEDAAGDPATLAAAWMVWLHMGCDCAKRRTDGYFNLARARRVIRLPEAMIDAALAALVAARLYDVEGEGWRYHDWPDYQPTKEEVDADRRANADRQKAWRIRQKEQREAKARNAVSNGVTDAVTDAVTNGVRNAQPSRETVSVDTSTPAASSVTAPRPVPSRPVPEIQNSEPVASALRAAPTVAGQDDGAELERLRAEKAKDDARKARNRAKAKAREENPPPFTIGAAFEFIASTAGGRFVPGVDRDWTRGIRIATANLIRTYPTREEWERLGRWLAAGGDAFRKILGPSWVASTACADAMARSREWSAKGEGPVGDPMQSGARTVQLPLAPRPPHAPVPRVIGVPVENPASPEDVRRALASVRALGGSNASR